METNLSQIIVYNPMGEFYIYIYWEVGKDIPSGASLWIFYCKGCVTVNLSGCYRRGTRPKDNLFAKAWFSYFGKISGDQVFLFFLTISDFVDILHSHQNSFADFTDIELAGNGR